MARILHDKDNFERMMDLTSDTLILLSSEGICLDVQCHSDLWFLQEKFLLNKNIFELLPTHTYEKAILDFEFVRLKKQPTFRKYKLPLRYETYYAECKLMPYDDMILCRYIDITQRENIELKLTQINEEMYEIQRAAKIGRWKLNIEKKLLIFNELDRKTKLPKKIAMPLDEYMQTIIPEDREKVQYWLDRSIGKLNKENISYRILKYGKIYYINSKCILYYQSSSNEGLFLEGISQDTTDIQKRRNDINTLTHAVFNVNESIYCALADGTMKFANQIFRKGHGVPIDGDITKYKVYDFHLGFAKDKKGWKERVISMDDKLEMDFKDYNHPVPGNPNILAYEGKFYKILEDDGVYSYWSFAHDVTAKLSYESEIKRYTELMDAILDNLPASVLVKNADDDFRYIYSNKYASEHHYIDESRESFVGQTDFDFLPKEMAFKIRLEDLHLLETKQATRNIVKEVTKGGTVYYYDKRKLLLSSTNHQMVLVIRWDITQQKKMEQDLMEAKKQAEESDRLKTVFLSNMSHEIRTPLNAIVGFSELLTKSENYMERESYFRLINKSSERLVKLINEILLLSRIEAKDIDYYPQKFSLMDILQEVYDVCNQHRPQDIELVIDPPTNDCILFTDSSYVFQLYSILIENAFKFTTKGAVHFGFAEKGKYIHFYVTDSGVRLTPDEIKDIFSLFTKYNYGNGGFGLELAICRALIQIMGGKIEAKSNKDDGIIFTFVLPKEQDNVLLK